MILWADGFTASVHAHLIISADLTGVIALAVGTGAAVLVVLVGIDAGLLTVDQRALTAVHADAIATALPLRTSGPQTGVRNARRLCRVGEGLTDEPICAVDIMTGVEDALAG